MARYNLSVITPHDFIGERFDILNTDHVDALPWNVDVVYLFAGVNGTLKSFLNPIDYLNINILGLGNILRSIEKSNYRPRIVFPSSRLVYKGSVFPLTEESPKEAKTVYAASKIAAEHLLEAYAKNYDLPCTIIRLCVPYGSLSKVAYGYGTIGNMVDQARGQGIIRLFGDGAMRRTFTHVADLCEIFVRLGLPSKETFGLFNMPGDNLSLIEAAQGLSRRFNAKIEMIEWTDEFLRIESGDTVFDGSRLIEKFMWTASYSFFDWVDTVDL